MPIQSTRQSSGNIGTPYSGTTGRTAGPPPAPAGPNITPDYGDWRNYISGPGSVRPQGGDPRQDAYDQVFRLLAKLEDAGTRSLQTDFNLTEQDKQLSQQVMDSTNAAATNALTAGAGQIARSITGAFADRGLSGSTMEAAQAGTAQKSLQDQLFQILNQSRGEQAQFLMAQPMERARTNAMMFNALTQAAMPALNWRQSQLMVGVPNRGKPEASQYVGQAIGAAADIGKYFLPTPKAG